MRLLNYHELAAKLGMTTDALRIRISRNPDDYPPKIKIGRSVRFEEGTVEAWIKSKNARGERYFSRA